MAFQDLVGQALGNAAEVLKARYGARVGGTEAVQDASLNAVNRPNDIQAKAASYTLPGGFPIGQAALVVVALIGVYLVVRK